MDIILENAKQFAEGNFGRFDPRIGDYRKVLTELKKEIAYYDDPSDKIKFIQFILNRNNSDYSKHLKVCQSPEDCAQNHSYENVAHGLKQELRKLNVIFNDDTFTESEKNIAVSKLDQIIKDLNEIKLGQQVIYEDLTKEIHELRELFYLGKKNWYQLLLGKSVEMVASGVVSEVTSKTLIETVKGVFPTLLGS